VTNGDKERLAAGAVIALTFISVLAVVCGLTMAWFGLEIEGVLAIVSGAVGGIVAIVLRDKP
jgi:membrane associated rhomboid family serine protease